LNEHLAGKLREKGFESVVLPPTHNFDEEKLVSDWSHKHIAYIAGLGNFGLHQLLITEKGCCGRLGSLVTNAPTTPNKRSGKENCLYKKNGSCGMCVNNCFSGALSKKSFNRHTCYKYCLANAKLYEKFGLADVCGKCACGVPCSFQNPVR
jgi:epoxyqueuosine reductase QueG